MTAEQYLKEHGINEESIKRFHITSDDHELNIPIKNVNDQIIWVKHRNLEYDPDDKDSKKYINDTGSKVALFNIRSHSTKKTIVLAEGEMDAIRLDQEGIPAVAATAGAETFNRELAEQLEGKTVYIVYDNDEAGKKGIRKVLEFIPQAKIIELPLDSSDVCDFFTLHTKQDFVELLKRAQSKEEWEIKYQPEDYSTLSLKDLYEQEFPEEEWLIERVIPQVGIVMLVGEAGAGKSFLALEAAKAISTGSQFINHFDTKTQGAVLIIDKENGLRRLQKRMQGLKIPIDSNIYLLKYPEHFTLDKEDFMQSVANFIQAQQIRMVILDSFIDILIGSENDAGDTQEVINAIRSISPNVCWLILHHDTKPMPHTQRSASQKTRGSSNIIGQVDNQFYIEKTKNPLIINIEQGKARDGEPVKKFQLEFDNVDEEMTGFRYLGEVQDEVSKVNDAADFVINYLTNNSNSPRQYIIDAGAASGVSSRSIDRAIKMLKEKSIIDFIKSGSKNLFFLTNEDEQDDELANGEQLANITD